ncbi:hypothetical protein [Mesorhizobium amorphae]|uniref:hypothetical protein n=1 Tax=Mesorhizobium amorphae TaxID=71433 RepID=UPI0011129900|nr:hypothetical protein [Mesorhizobium amorphae]
MANQRQRRKAHSDLCVFHFSVAFKMAAGWLLAFPVDLQTVSVENQKFFSEQWNKQACVWPQEGVISTA